MSSSHLLSKFVLNVKNENELFSSCHTKKSHESLEFSLKYTEVIFLLARWSMNQPNLFQWFKYDFYSNNKLKHVSLIALWVVFQIRWIRLIDFDKLCALEGSLQEHIMNIWLFCTGLRTQRHFIIQFIKQQAWASSLCSVYHSCDQFAKIHKSALKCRETGISVLP